MTDHQQPTAIEYLRSEVLDRMAAQPFDDWSPALLRALIAVFDLNGSRQRPHTGSAPTSSGRPLPGNRELNFPRPHHYAAMQAHLR